MQENAISSSAQVGVRPYKDNILDEYISFCALGGMLVSDTGAISPMTSQQFCQQHGIDESTTWRWKKKIPDFAMRVRQRRNELVPLARETAAFNRLYMIGMTSLPTKVDRDGKPHGALHNDQRAAVDALKTYVGHYSDLQLPTQRQEIKVQGGLMEVLAAAEKDGIIEGETIEPTSLDAGASQETPSPLPPTS